MPSNKSKELNASWCGLVERKSCLGNKLVITLKQPDNSMVYCYMACPRRIHVLFYYFCLKIGEMVELKGYLTAKGGHKAVALYLVALDATQQDVRSMIASDLAFAHDLDISAVKPRLLYEDRKIKNN